ncbi:MAG: hypothetical protein JSS81_14755 [Acidobacteria bacterium]|nr:hypothetical protein [Acidobacteriota bacterium]
MSKPPQEIDGAKVLFWAWSGPVPFGFVGDEKDPLAAKIFGLAICRYEGSEQVYRFSCDENWETQQDAFYDSAEQAIDELPDQYKNVRADWIEFED